MSDKTKLIVMLLIAGGGLMIGGGILADVYHYRFTPTLMILMGATGFLRAFVEDQT